LKVSEIDPDCALPQTAGEQPGAGVKLTVAVPKYVCPATRS
jgi:hypothetical protein